MSHRSWVQPQASWDIWDNWSLKHSFLLMWRFLFTDWLVQWACTRGVQTVLPSGYSRSPCHQHPRHVWEGVHSICQTAGGVWWYPRSHWPVCGLLLQQGQRGTLYDIYYACTQYDTYYTCTLYDTSHVTHVTKFAIKRQNCNILICARHFLRSEKLGPVITSKQY